MRCRRFERFSEFLLNGGYNNLLKMVSILIGHCDDIFRHSFYVNVAIRFDVKIFYDNKNPNFLTFKQK